MAQQEMYFQIAPDPFGVYTVDDESESNAIELETLGVSYHRRLA